MKASLDVIFVDFGSAQCVINFRVSTRSLFIDQSRLDCSNIDTKFDIDLAAVTSCVDVGVMVRGFFELRVGVSGNLRRWV